MAKALPFHFPVILGWDAAGVVEKVGPAVTWFKPGDEVYGYLRRHTCSTAPTPSTRPAPRASSRTSRRAPFEEAARCRWPVADRPPGAGGARPARRRVAVLAGGAGGVGHFAIQLAVARGARVVATASSATTDFLRELGAEPLDYDDRGRAARVRDLPGDSGADAAFDLFGGDARSRRSRLRPGGRLVSIARRRRSRATAPRGRTTSSCARAATGPRLRARDGR
jgi:NADPH:quinone reductase-like Zn-dependent oxidoreductase